MKDRFDRISRIAGESVLLLGLAATLAFNQLSSFIQAVRDIALARKVH